MKEYYGNLRINEISVDIKPGVSLYKVAKSAISLAEKFNCLITFEWQGIPIGLSKDNIPEQAIILVNAQLKVLETTKV
jgi:hypothetical protein